MVHCRSIIDSVPTLNPKIWVVIVNFNGLADTRKCLRSLRTAVDRTAVVVVDNASLIDEVALIKDEFPWVEVVRNPTNGGWAGGNNRGLGYALERGAELMVLLNNDTVVEPNFVERMTAAAAAHPDFGILGPVIRCMDPPHEVQTEGTYFNRIGGGGFFQKQSVPLSTTGTPTVVETDIVNGCCLMVRCEVIDRIGLIDEAYFLIHEEADFCLRAKAAGFLNGILAEDLVRHKGSSTFRREGNRYQRYYDARNLVRLIQRHSGLEERRGRISSLLRHLRYAYHRYSLEIENGSDAAAEAVLEGLWDAYCGRYGPWAPRFRPGVGLIRWLFRAASGLRRLQRCTRTRTAAKN